jgi:hypothetical protein
MRRLRDALLTDYIGAMVVALLVYGAFVALFTTVAEQISYHVYVPRGRQPLSITYSVLSCLTRILLYLISAYSLARWLYPANRQISNGDRQQANFGTGERF